MKPNYRVAIVGAGVIAQQHLRALRKLDCFHTVAVCDKDEEKAIRTCREWKVERHYTDFSRMLEKEDPSIISILTPPQSHAQIAIEALKKDVNVLVEKPMTMNAHDATSILDATKNSTAKLTVAYHELFSRMVQEALTLVRRGEIGKLLGTSVSFLAAPADDDMGSNPRHWCHSILGGRFGEMLPHPVYLSQAFLGNELHIDRAVCSKRGQRPWMPNDELQILLHGDGGTGHVYVSFNAARTLESLDIYGTERILRLDMTDQISVSLGHRTTGKMSSLGNILGLAAKLCTGAARNAFRYYGRPIGEYALEHIYQSFIDSIEGRGELPVTPEMAFETVKIVEQVCNQMSGE